MTTPTVSASQEMTTPQPIPKTTPFAVEIKIDGKKPSALISTSMIKLSNIAQTPKERRYSAILSMSPLVVIAHNKGKKLGLNKYMATITKISRASTKIFKYVSVFIDCKGVPPIYIKWGDQVETMGESLRQ